MSITRGFRWFVVLALLSSVAAASSHADTNPPPDHGERPSTIVVRVNESGFHWADAGVGAAAALAATLLALGLVLTLRADHRGNGKP